MTLLKQSLVLNSRNKDANYYLGIITRLEGDEEQAKEYFLKADSGDPSLAEIREEIVQHKSASG